MTGINWTELIVLAVLFLIVAAMGFVAANWRRPERRARLSTSLSYTYAPSPSVAHRP